MAQAGSLTNRRRLLTGVATGLILAASAPRGAFAEQLAQTAPTGEGPFYPDKMPLDTDNDLLIINDATTPAVGQVTHLAGRILSATAEPIRNAFVEIWQVDSTASYVHTRGRQPSGNDPHFQGYGRFLTDSTGRYYFRTIKPISYTLLGGFRTAHIHIAVSKNGRRIFTSQIFVQGQPENARDGIIKNLDAAALKTLLVDFTPMPGSKIGEWSANFDVILGRTVAEFDDGTLRGGIGISEIQHRPS